jgi:hypothetical protein
MIPHHRHPHAGVKQALRHLRPQLQSLMKLSSLIRGFTHAAILGLIMMAQKMALKTF